MISFKLYLVCHCLLNLVTATNILYMAKDGKYYEKNISGRKISSDNIDSETPRISIQRSSSNEPQINTISNLAQLTHLWIQGIGQEHMPKILNLPKLTHYYLANNSLSYVPDGRFANASHIHLNTNKIRAIEDEAFGTGVVYLRIACNLLEKFKSEWFQNPAALEEIDLMGNRLEQLEENQFKEFTSMNKINIAFNNIHTIGAKAFANTRYFQYLYMAYNKITDLPSSAFKSGNITIYYFDIQFNNLTFLPLDLMRRVKLSATPKIDGNPWQCPCYWNHITKWIQWDGYGGESHPVDRPEEPRCISSIGSFSLNCVEIVDNELIDTFWLSSSPPPHDIDRFCDCFRKTGQGTQCVLDTMKQ